MLNTIRQRLFLSHILPVLVTAPLAGLLIQWTIDKQMYSDIPAGNGTSDFLGQYLPLRYLIFFIVIGGMILGVFIGWILSRNAHQSLVKITEAIQQLSEDHHPNSLPESGPEEIRNLFTAVNKLSERLVDREKSRSKMLASLIHELGRPIGALRSAVEALQNGAMENYQASQDLLGGMGLEMIRLHRLLEDIVQLSKGKDFDLDLNLVRVDLSHWLPQMLLLWGESARMNGLDWQTDIAPDLPTLEIDPDRLGQALGNLLSNAIKYTPTGGFVRVRSRKDSDGVIIQVSDNGLGIPIEVQERIFKPFCWGQSAVNQQSGMGLGLSIVEDLVKAHEGRVMVESMPGLGSQFTIFLPQSKKQEERK